jgi:hypothetical protein
MLSLRFVEIVADQKTITPIPVLADKASCVVGHKGDILPKICNGRISRRHCTVTYNAEFGLWAIKDGVEGNPSQNGLYDADGGRVQGLTTLSKAGDRIYLLAVRGFAAFLEVVDSTAPEQPAKPAPEERQEQPTLGFEAHLFEISQTVGETAAKVKAADQKIVAVSEQASGNSDSIQDLKDWRGQVTFVLAVLEKIGKNWGIYLTAIAVIILAGSAGMSMLSAWIYKEQIVKPYLDDRLRQIEQRQTPRN